MHTMKFKGSIPEYKSASGQAVHRHFRLATLTLAKSFTFSSKCRNISTALVLIATTGLLPGCSSEQDTLPVILPAIPVETTAPLPLILSDAPQVALAAETIQVTPDNTASPIREINWYLQDSKNFKSAHWCNHSQSNDIIHQ